MGNALLRGKRIIVYPVYRVKCSNQIHTQGINGALDQQLPNGLAGLLQSGHASVSQGLPEKQAVHGEFPFTKLQHGNLPIYIDDAQDCGSCFCNHGGGGGAHNPKSKAANEYQIQDRI